VIFFVIIIAHFLYTIIYHIKIKQKSWCSSKLIYEIIIGVFICFGSFAYFLGDNLSSFAKNIEMNESIIAKIDASRAPLLITAIILYRVFPHGMKKIFEEHSYSEESGDNKKQKQPKNNDPLFSILEEAAIAIVLTMDFDAWFTVIQSTDLCASSVDIGFSWFLWALMFCVYIIIMILSVLFRVIRSDNGGCFYVSVGCITAITMSIVNSLYLLVDNMHPLSCHNDGKNVHIMRLVVLFIAFIIYLIVLILYGTSYINRKRRSDSTSVQYTN
jgi:hypothetical protein